MAPEIKLSQVRGSLGWALSSIRNWGFVGEGWTSIVCDWYWKFLLVKLSGLAHGLGFGEQWLSQGWKPQRDTCSEGSIAGWAGSVPVSTALQTQTNSVCSTVWASWSTATPERVWVAGTKSGSALLVVEEEGPYQQDSVPTSVHPPPSWPKSSELLIELSC